MIKHYTLKALQKTIRHALALDPNSIERLKALEGKSVKIMIRPLGTHFYMVFNDTQLTLREHLSHPPDTIIHSSPLGFIRLSLLPASKVRSLFNDQIKISGDLSLGQDLKKLFDDLDIDWEGHLAQFTGDVVAYQIGKIFRFGHQFTRETKSALEHHVSEYLHEEIRLFPSREELSDFFEDVDELMLATERLEAHVNQLIARYEID